MRWRGLPIAGLAALAACAGAKAGADDDGNAVDGAPRSDAAATPDGVPQPVTLTQSSDSATITPMNSIGCINQQTGVTRENSYYRAFTLTEHGVNSDFLVSSVSFGIEQAMSPSGSQPATVTIYNYTGAIGANLDTGAMSVVASSPIVIQNVPGTTVMTAPIAGLIPAGGTMVAEIAIPDSDPDQNGSGVVFFIGSNVAGQTKPGYIRAPVNPGCNIQSPTQLTMVPPPPGFPNMHMVLTVTGTPM